MREAIAEVGAGEFTEGYVVRVIDGCDEMLGAGLGCELAVAAALAEGRGRR